MTSSKTMSIDKKLNNIYIRLLKKSSNPHRVPTISLSFFISIHTLEPMHLSSNSNGLLFYFFVYKENENKICKIFLIPRGKILVINLRLN
jgi:hypothetical protein